MTDITFNFTPDVGYQPDIVPAVNRVKFGGGYTQTSARGINLDGATLRMSFTNRTKTEVDGIVWALKQSLGGRIIYTLPGETTARLWDVQRWTPPVCGEGGQVWSMEVELSETFEDGHANWNPLHLDLSSPDGWTWKNQGTATATWGASGVELTLPWDSLNGVLRGVYRPMPKAGSWSITSEVAGHTFAGSQAVWSMGGIAVGNSRTGVVVGVGEKSGGDGRGGFLLPAYTPDATLESTAYDLSIHVDRQTGTVVLTRTAGTSQTHTVDFSTLGGAPDQVWLFDVSFDPGNYYSGNNVLRFPYLYLDPL